MARLILAVACIIAMASIAVAAMFAPRPAHAQGFVDEPTCYTWNGGNFSAGSFSKCTHWEVAKAPPPPTPPAPAPVMMSTPVCPPQVILEPEPRKRKAPVHRRAPPPKCNP